MVMMEAEALSPGEIIMNIDCSNNPLGNAGNDGAGGVGGDR